MSNVILQKLPQLVGPLPLSVIRLTGTTRFATPASTMLCAAYVGNGSNLIFLRDLFFRDAVAETLQSGIHPLRMHAALAKLRGSVDLLLSELPPVWAALLPAAGTIRLPAWVRQELSIATATNSPAGAYLPRAVEKEVARHIRRHGYVMDLTTSAQDKRVFFHEFYRPYVQSRFRHGACVADERVFMQKCQEQTLARLHTGNRWVAGMLIRREGANVRLGWFGANTDPPSPGSSEVLDTLVIRHARANGVTRIVMGDSRPCLADGVVRYKAKFGATITSTTFPQPSLYIDAPSWTEPLREALVRLPLVTVRRGHPYVYRIHEPPAAAAVRLEPLRRPRAGGHSTEFVDEHHSTTQ